MFSTRIRQVCYLGLGLGLAPGILEAQTQCSRQALSTHQAYYCVSGHGGPTIVLASGTGLTSNTWDSLVPDLVTLGTVVTFDRAGLGESTASRSARTPSQVAAELAELLELIGVPTPYILVGHSAGGWHMLRFVEQFPNRVSGVVLVDTPPIEFEARRLTVLNDEEREERSRMLAQGARTAPEMIRRERADGRVDIDRGFSALPVDVPLVVVAADDQEFGSGMKDRALRDLWVELSRGWLRLADTGRFIVAQGSGHMIHRERPELLIDAIRSLVPEEVLHNKHLKQSQAF